VNARAEEGIASLKEWFRGGTLFRKCMKRYRIITFLETKGKDVRR
jgi:hypothetical protein